MYRAIQDIYKNKKPLLTLCSEKGLTTNEEKTTETLTQYFAKLFTRITQQQMQEPIPMSEPFTWKEIYEASLKLNINKSPDNNGLQAEHIKYAPKCVHQDTANQLIEVAETGIIRVCPTSLILLWRRIFDRAVAPVLFANSALDMQTGK